MTSLCIIDPCPHYWDKQYCPNPYCHGNNGTKCNGCFMCTDTLYAPKKETLKGIFTPMPGDNTAIVLGTSKYEIKHLYHYIEVILTWLKKIDRFELYPTFFWITSDADQNDIYELETKCNEEIIKLYNMAITNEINYDVIIALVNKIAITVGTNARAK